MKSRTILRTTLTISDQPIALPQKNPEVVVSILESSNRVRNFLPTSIRLRAMATSCPER